MTKAKHGNNKQISEPENSSEMQVENGAGASETPPSDAALRIEELEREVEASRSQMLRAVADYQNLKRRSEQDRLEIRRFATESLVKELLPVLDSFERALAASSTDTDPALLLEGLKAIERQIRMVLESVQVRKIATEGESFDPERHDALVREDHPELPEGTVSGEIEPGYTMADRVIRPAKVKVVAKS